jgi:hypothetical protein
VDYLGFDLLFDEEAFDLLDSGGLDDGGFKLFCDC